MVFTVKTNNLDKDKRMDALNELYFDYSIIQLILIE